MISMGSIFISLPQYEFRHNLSLKTIQYNSQARNYESDIKNTTIIKAFPRNLYEYFTFQSVFFRAFLFITHIFLDNTNIQSLFCAPGFQKST